MLSATEKSACVSEALARRAYENQPVEILRFSETAAHPIGHRPYEVARTASIEFAGGEGEAHAYVIYFEPGGVIGAHEAGFGQILYAVAGSGWVAAGDGVRVALAEGEAAFIRRGETHAKGSETGMTALMIQVRDLDRVATQG
jgi:quercetin dioxygenase-like cupin family protein